MKLLLFSLFFIPLVACSQPVSSPKTKKEVENFIIKNLKYNGFKYENFEIDTINTEEFDKFKEGDFNHDGVEDFLVSGEATINLRKQKYQEHLTLILVNKKPKPVSVNVPNRAFYFGISCKTRKIVNIGGKDYIIYKIGMDKHDFEGDSSKSIIKEIDTLFIKYDHLMPFSNYPSQKEITRVEFKTEPCFGSCPVFELMMNQNLEVAYKGIDYVDKKGDYDLRMDRKDWDYLTELIKNLRVEDLLDRYAVNWTDDQTAYLTVYYKDGSKKTIEDYGLSGTFGLTILYDFMFELRKF